MTSSSGRKDILAVKTSEESSRRRPKTLLADMSRPVELAYAVAEELESALAHTGIPSPDPRTIETGFGLVFEGLGHSWGEDEAYDFSHLTDRELAREILREFPEVLEEARRML